MTTLYEYPDAYLAKHCNEDREARAIEAVGVMAGTRLLSDPWTEALVITQCYIIACLENQAKVDDLFYVKLKAYRSQLSVQLPQAITAADEAADIAGAGAAFFSIPLERA